MKILQLGKFFPIKGGVEKVEYDLMRGLAEQGIDCDMLCASLKGKGDIISNGKHARIICCHTLMQIAGTMIAPSMITTLWRICRKYDIIHVHHPDPMACLALFLSGYKGKVVLHWHSDILTQKILLKFYRPLQEWLINRADVIVGTTPVYVQQSLALQGVQEKVDFIPIGVKELSFNQDKVDQIRRKYAGKKIVLSIGRLVRYKVTMFANINSG